MNKSQLKQLIREEIKRSLKESVNERERQLRDPKKEMLVVKDGKVIVIDKEDFNEYKRKGWLTAEGVK
jgi:predicted AAA+ superfamily ATPase